MTLRKSINQSINQSIIDAVALGQFIAQLPRGTAEWVQCHHPALLDQAIELAEDHLAAVPVAVGHPASLSLSFCAPFLLFLPSLPTPWKQGPIPLQPAPRAHGSPSPSSPCVSVSSPKLSVPHPSNAEVRLGPVCWRCGEPWHFQDQCQVMEVGAVAQVPNAPEAAPDQTGTYRIPTDVLDRGLGAVLSQMVEERPVPYISRNLSMWEGKYSTIEKEHLAIKWAVLTLRYYLLGCPFTLCSDHDPLQWLHRMKDANAWIWPYSHNTGME
ncbi:uncharacterized protein LOC132883151 isoform X2 [Neoarius graeffei]|uniref:uncharacterized protein LOC132883151 isoform X2 n=1 Tax=Neoarius graeffei TaxID=443677 RepID=UPI00298C14BF|nr:uncharacterized protein LOC132883151 isoform X2 [Neoarius graeffei]